jgi:hypothetical protein
MLPFSRISGVRPITKPKCPGAVGLSPPDRATRLRKFGFNAQSSHDWTAIPEDILGMQRIVLKGSLMEREPKLKHHGITTTGYTQRPQKSPVATSQTVRLVVVI